MRLLAGVGATAALVFIALTILVVSSDRLAIDAHAFDIARDLRTPWLDGAARIGTTPGLIVIVGLALGIGAVPLIRGGHLARALTLLTGWGVASAAVWVIKSAVARPRPPRALVHAVGDSYPSGHSVHAVGWLALAVALTVVIPTRAGRVAALVVGAMLALVIGLSRTYLRAHHLTDVLGGEALATAIYALAAVAAVTWRTRRRSRGRRETSSSS